MADKPDNKLPNAAQGAPAVAPVSGAAPAKQGKPQGLSDDELGAALDSLLSSAKDAQQTVAKAASVGATHDDIKADADALTADAKADDGKSDADAIAGDIVGDDLADQIQDLLDTAASAAAAAPASASPATHQTNASRVTDASATIAAPAAAAVGKNAEPTASAAPAKPPHAAEKAAPIADAAAQPATNDRQVLEVDDEITGDPVSVEEMDAMLAKEAEEAVSGKFETTESIESTEAPATPPADTDTAATAPSALAEAPADAKATSTDPVAHNVDNSVVEEDDAVAGQFEAPDDLTEEKAEETPASAAATSSVNSQPVEKVEPEPVAEKPAEAALTPGAAAVAKELDEQPEKTKAAAAAAAPALAKSVTTKPPEPAPPERPRPPRIGFVKRLCIMLNAPLINVTPQVRDAVGWVALLTVFNSVVLIAVAAMPKKAAADADHGAEVAGVDSHGAKPDHGASSGGGKAHGGSAGHGDAKKPDAHAPPKKPDSHAPPKKPASGGHGASEKAKKPASSGGH